MRKEGERGYGKTHRWRREEQRVKIILDLNRRDENVGFVCSDPRKSEDSLSGTHALWGKERPPSYHSQTKKGVLQPGKPATLVAPGSIGDKGDK